MDKYGEYIKALREAKGLTLRDVEKKINVSNAYLSQLESGKIKNPSPHTLYKLSELYDIPYEVLMKKVGYPVPSFLNVTELSENQTVYGKLGKMSKDEEIELLQYLKFIRNKKQR